jgi:acyl dehydratase
MPLPEFIQIGDELPAFTTGPISRATLALYAGASGDHNPMHIDIDFARESGMDDVIAHGMLGMAYLGRLLTNWVSQEAIRQFSVRFLAITHVHDRLTCKGKIVEQNVDNQENLIRVDLSLINQDGDLKLSGQAVIAL